MAHLAVRALLGRLSGEIQIEVANSMLNAMHLETLDGMEDICDGGEDSNMVNICAQKVAFD